MSHRALPGLLALLIPCFLFTLYSTPAEQLHSQFPKTCLILPCLFLVPSTFLFPPAKTYPVHKTLMTHHFLCVLACVSPLHKKFTPSLCTPIALYPLKLTSYFFTNQSHTFVSCHVRILILDLPSCYKQLETGQN